MAFCPQCQAKIGATAAKCPSCGYDFPGAGDEPEPKREGIAYSALADIALMVSGVAAGLGCLAAVLGCIEALILGQWLVGLVVCPIAFFLQLGMLVVFLRIQNV